MSSRVSQGKSCYPERAHVTIKPRTCGRKVSATQPKLFRWPRLVELARTTFQRFARADVGDARVAVKVATALEMPLSRLGVARAVARFVRALVRASKADAKALRPAVAMLRAYPELLDELGEEGGSCAGVLAEVVGNGHRSAAVEVAHSLDRPRKVRAATCTVGAPCASPDSSSRTHSQA
jgi:hypothetical protein